jgi:hypothetical protein
MQQNRRKTMKLPAELKDGGTAKLNNRLAAERFLAEMNATSSPAKRTATTAIAPRSGHGAHTINKEPSKGSEPSSCSPSAESVACNPKKVRRGSKERTAEAEEIFKKLSLISGGMPLSDLNRMLGLYPNSMSHFCNNPELVTPKWMQDVLVPKLIAAFPGKETGIEGLRLAVGIPPLSVTKIKQAERKIKDFRLATGQCMRELRTEFGLDDIEAVRERLTTPIVKRNLERIESGDKGLPTSIYRTAINEACVFYKTLAPLKAAPFTMRLELYGSLMKP